VTLEIPEYGICYESYGGNDNGGVKSKNYDLGDAYKGATTDAITKIGSYLEIGIDVFKGQPATRVVEAKEQPKLKFDGAALTRLKEAVKNGTAIDMEMVLSKYTVSPKMKEKIEEVLNG
jgi:hypothetical protein